MRQMFFGYAKIIGCIFQHHFPTDTRVLHMFGNFFRYGLAAAEGSS